MLRYSTLKSDNLCDKITVTVAWSSFSSSMSFSQRFFIIEIKMQDVLNKNSLGMKKLVLLSKVIKATYDSII